MENTMERQEALQLAPVIIIPALNPDRHLLGLVARLQFLSGNEQAIVVVNDGSAQKYGLLFWRLEREYGCTVLHHKQNMGKGAALKTAMAYIQAAWPECAGCVTADADGQHDASDILAVADMLQQQPHSLILGTRDFSGQNAPLKSRWGNRISSLLFRLATRYSCPDTQTGLRGIPARLFIPFGKVAGQRYEYEMNILFYAAKHGIGIKTVPIRTIYRDNNSHSYFRGVRDSLRVYSGFARYALSALLSAALDLTLFAVLMNAWGEASWGVFAATALARISSGVLNFTMNKLLVFRSRGNSMAESAKYIMLFVGQMSLSALLVGWLSGVLPSVGAKVIVDTVLFFISYFVQSRFIFHQQAYRLDWKAR